MFGLFQPDGRVQAGGPSSPQPHLQQPHGVLGTPIDAPLADGQAQALFGCGCFWGAEKGFWRLPGVVTTAVGYAGGHGQHPRYEQVCSGRTGHCEVVRVVWDPALISFADLLKLFWECHDPTQGDRQGNDRGSQYRSAIYVNEAELLLQAEASRVSYQERLKTAGFGSITTEIRSDVSFYPAEPYHQQYLARPGSRPYCSAQPTRVPFEGYPGAAFLLDPRVWQFYDWSLSHCVLRGENAPIRFS
ncbi:MAG: peptide-methionine (S)-S-oxide reductase MsrA [Cyanobacteriota bacterium]